MTNYTEAFFEEHVWDTNWKVLAENFMESYHLPVCHAARSGACRSWMRWSVRRACPPSTTITILKDESLRIAMAHPSNTRLKGDARRTTFLLAIYPSLLITLTPVISGTCRCTRRGRGRSISALAAAMSDDYKDDPDAQKNFSDLKALLDDVNVEDRGCTEKVFRGLSSDLARPGHLSHLERPNYDFATYLVSKVCQ